MDKVVVYDSTASDQQSHVRGVGRYLQLLKENLPKNTIFTDDLRIITDQSTIEQSNHRTIFINPFFNFLRPPLLMKRIAYKQIAIIHDLIPLKHPKHFPAGIRGNINILLNKLALTNYDLIVTDSEASKKDIIKILGISESKTKVIYPCLPKIFTNSKSEILNPKQFLKLKINNLKCNENLKLKIENFCLYVGDATWNKNLVNLAKAIKIINVPCIFVGKVFKNNNRAIEQLNNDTGLDHPWNRELLEFLQLAKDDKKFIFLGYVQDYKLVKLYQQTKVNILISRDEGFGFSFVEAAHFSCPSVLSDIPVFQEISAKKGALFANPEDPNDLANKIGEIYFNHQLRQKLANEAYQRSKYFYREKFLSCWLNILTI